MPKSVAHCSGKQAGGKQQIGLSFTFTRIDAYSAVANRCAPFRNPQTRPFWLSRYTKKLPVALGHWQLSGCLLPVPNQNSYRPLIA